MTIYRKFYATRARFWVVADGRRIVMDAAWVAREIERGANLVTIR